MKLTDNDLSWLSLLMIPAFFFGFALKYANNAHWYSHFDVLKMMMLICCFIGSIAFGTLLSRKWK